MQEISQEYVNADDDMDLARFVDIEDNELLPVGEDLNGPEQARSAGLKISPPVNYLERARAVLTPLGARGRLIEFAAGIHMFLDLLKSPGCNTQKREALAARELSACVDGALTELVADISLRINQVAALALEVRGQVPDIYDTWVNLQFTIGKPLAMVTARRNAFDLPRERMIEEGIENGKLVLGAVTPTLRQLENLVAIARLTLEAELSVTTVAEQLELDDALSDFIMARRISSAAQSLIRPSGPDKKDLAEALKLIAQAKTFDKAFHRTIDRMRLRNRRRSRTVQVALEKKITLAVDTGAQEPDEKIAALA